MAFDGANFSLKCLTTGLALLLVALVAVAALANAADVSPRLLARYIDRRVEGHNQGVAEAGHFVAALLLRADRGNPISRSVYPSWTGATSGALSKQNLSAVGGRMVTVSTIAELRTALDAATPGEQITLTPGTYTLSGPPLVLARAGTADEPIVVRAEQLGGVVIESTLLEGFQVSGPYWTFENFTMRGVCKRDSNCEHAFHVVGEARHFTARNLVVQDFNAQFKINGLTGKYPDNGVTEHSTLTNTRARKIDRPVTPIDIVAASSWRIEGNLIADFIKAGGDGTSYGVFAKGSASNTHISRNVVLCEYALRRDAGRRVGVSFGGGGTAPANCRDGKCIVEHQSGVLSDNLIAGCSDVGICLNRASRTIVSQNTLLDTAGVEVRFPESVADLQGNLLDGPVRVRDGALVRENDDRRTSAAWLFIGKHPIRSYFVDSPELDLDWRNERPLRESGTTASLDLCGVTRGARSAYGAFDDIRRCVAN